jgi:hypothetical protein
MPAAATAPACRRARSRFCDFVCFVRDVFMTRLLQRVSTNAPSAPNETPMTGLSAANQSAQSSFPIACRFRCMAYLLSSGRSNFRLKSARTNADTIEIAIMARPPSR